MFFGYNGTVKSPTGFTFGFASDKILFTMFARFSPMNLTRLTGTNVDKDLFLRDGQLVDETNDEFEKFYIPNGYSYIRRYSMGYMYGRKIFKSLYWYVGMGYGGYLTQVEYDEFHLGSYSDTHGVIDKDRSARGLETDVGIMFSFAESLVIQGGVSTVNFSFSKFSLDPSFSIAYFTDIGRSRRNRTRALNKFVIKQ